MDTMETATAQNQGETILELKISEIQPNPFQPRTHFDPAQLEELASSIREAVNVGSAPARWRAKRPYLRWCVN